jgi:hypothetical protein
MYLWRKAASLSSTPSKFELMGKFCGWTNKRREGYAGCWRLEAFRSP